MLETGRPTRELAGSDVKTMGIVSLSARYCDLKGGGGSIEKTTLSCHQRHVISILLFVQGVPRLKDAVRETPGCFGVTELLQKKSISRALIHEEQSGETSMPIS